MKSFLQSSLRRETPSGSGVAYCRKPSCSKGGSPGRVLCPATLRPRSPPPEGGLPEEYSPGNTPRLCAFSPFGVRRRLTRAAERSRRSPPLKRRRFSNSHVIQVDSPVRTIAALVNPLGDDLGKEMVTLINTGSASISLEGWFLLDAMNNRYV